MFSNFGQMPDQKSFHPSRACALVLGALLLITAAHAAPLTPLTIAEAEDLALRDEPGLEELRANAGALQEQSVAAGSLPDMSLRVGLANFPIESGGFSTEGMTQAHVGIRQEFPRGNAPSPYSRYSLSLSPVRSTCFSKVSVSKNSFTARLPSVERPTTDQTMVRSVPPSGLGAQRSSATSSSVPGKIPNAPPSFF